MSDAKFFQRGKSHELVSQLNSSNAESTRKNALKRVIANISMGTDMAGVFSEVLNCSSIPGLEVKKMIYLYVVTYAPSKPELALMACNNMIRDTTDPNPLIRALALRTLSSINVDRVMETLCEPLRAALRDRDPYVCKTAAICVGKLFCYNSDLVLREGFLENLKEYLNHENSMVVANTVAVLSEISAKSNQFELALDMATANRLLTACDEATEWSQAYILEALIYTEPNDSAQTELLIERIVPRLQHSNTAIIMVAIRVILHLLHFVDRREATEAIVKRLEPPLGTLLHGLPEIQYVALRNIQLIIQKHTDFLKKNITIFFCKYNDPIYIKLSKLEVLYRLADQSNITIVLPELKEYASEVDVDFVSKAVRAIGRCAIKIDGEANRCVEVLVQLIQTKVNYIVQEAMIVIKDVFRKYPNQYESIIGILCENLESLEVPEAKASLIWVIGQYADRIENANELLGQFLETFTEEQPIVQLSLLTAVVKLFIKRPAMGQDLVPKVLKLATEDVENPDIRDRGYIYWRLLSTDPVAAKAIVLSDKPVTSSESDNMDPVLLSRLLYNISTLSSLSHKPPIMPLALTDRLLKLHYASESKAGQQAAPQKSNPIPANYATEDTFHSVKAVSRGMDLLSMDDPYSPAAQSSPGSTTNSSYASPQYALNPHAAPQYASNQYATQSAAVNPKQPQLQSQLPVDLFSSNSPAPANSSFQKPAVSNDLDIFGLVPQNASLPRNPTVLAGAPNLAAPGFSLLSQSSTGNPAATYGPLRTANMNAQAELLSMNLREGHVAPKTLWLAAQNGRGLEVQGTFVRRNGKVSMDMQFTNKAMQHLTDFAILFNKNTFGLTPAHPLELHGNLIPNQSIETTLFVKLDSVGQLTQPVNNLQVALKNNIGISYFQTQFPLYVLFSEDPGLAPQVWLGMWKEEIPPSNETQFRIPLYGDGNIVTHKNKLASNNIAFVAERNIEGSVALYSSVKLDDGTLFLVEFRFSPDFSGCQISVKTYAVHLVSVFQQAILDILTA